ncbi:MAG: DUF167 family protein [Candidatus Thermoplasmatota archaeon]|nr:DUF167 family protein [Candidatus Thermoplasmatota archaeon]
MEQLSIKIYKGTKLIKVPVDKMDITDSIRKSQDGTILDIFVTPKSKENIFPAGFDEWRKRIEIKISQPAKDNKANLATIKVISEFFGKSIRDICVVSGKKSREKSILIKDISVNNVANKIQEFLDGL